MTQHSYIMLLYREQLKNKMFAMQFNVRPKAAITGRFEIC
jgi:hypothetical protein